MVMGVVGTAETTPASELSDVVLQRWEAHVRAVTVLYNAGECFAAAAQLLAALRTAPMLAAELFSDEELLLANGPEPGMHPDEPNLTMAELMNVEAEAPSLVYLARALRSSRCSAPDQGVKMLQASLALLPRQDAQLGLLQRPLRMALAEARRGICAWRQHEAEERWLVNSLREKGAAGWRQLTAVLTLAFPITPPQWLQISRATLPAAGHLPSRSHVRLTGPPSRKPLRVAIASADNVRTHVLAHLQHATYRLFSPRIVRLCVVSMLAVEPAIASHIATSLGHRRDALISVESLKPAEAARKIADARIQLLLWVSEPGEGLRTLLAQRPAPVSTHHLAVPATTGCDAVHYFTLDGTAASMPSAARSMSERAVLLPNHYQVNSHALGLGPVGGEQLPDAPRRWRWPRASLANFGQTIRIDPTLLATLGRVLLRTSALLWLAAPGPLPRLRAELAALGIHQGRRCVISPRLGWNGYAARATAATLYVDTLHYNSHTTNVDMLWAGVPSLTARGGSLSSRVGASVGRAAGMPDAAVTSLRQYATSATHLVVESRRCIAGL